MIGNKFENMGCILYKRINPSVVGVTEEEAVRITGFPAHTETRDVANTSPGPNLLGRSYVSILCLLMGPALHHPASCAVGAGSPFPRGGKARPGRDAECSPLIWCRGQV
jgi:hypothetical protein